MNSYISAVWQLPKFALLEHWMRLIIQSVIYVALSAVYQENRSSLFSSQADCASHWQLSTILTRSSGTKWKKMIFALLWWERGVLRRLLKTVRNGVESWSTLSAWRGVLWVAVWRHRNRIPDPDWLILQCFISTAFFQCAECWNCALSGYNYVTSCTKIHFAHKRLSQTHASDI